MKLDHVADVSLYSSRLWLKDNVNIIGSLHVQLLSSEVQNLQHSRVDTIAEEVDNIFRSQIKGLEEFTIQMDIFHNTE